MQHGYWWAFWEERDEDDPYLIRGGLITVLLGPIGAAFAAVHAWRRGQHRIGGAFGVLGGLWVVVVASLIAVPLAVGSAVPSCSGVYTLSRGIAPAGDSGQWVKVNLHLQTSIAAIARASVTWPSTSYLPLVFTKHAGWTDWREWAVFRKSLSPLTNAGPAWGTGHVTVTDAAGTAARCQIEQGPA